MINFFKTNTVSLVIRSQISIFIHLSRSLSILRGGNSVRTRERGRNKDQVTKVAITTHFLNKNKNDLSNIDALKRVGQ